MAFTTGRSDDEEQLFATGISGNERRCGGRIVSSLEGGYSLSALGRSAVQHIKVLAGLDA